MILRRSELHRREGNTTYIDNTEGASGDGIGCHNAGNKRMGT